MNSLKNKLIFLTAVVLLVLSMGLVWHLVFYRQDRLANPDGTLVEAAGKLVKL